MIKIRYRDLSPGLHAAAERHGRSTTIYLIPGLTAPQRQAALRRLRLSARMGHCPRLPAGQFALALLADRVRTMLSQVGAMFRLHPAACMVPVMMASGAMITFVALSGLSVRMLPGPQGRPALGAPAPAASARAVPAAQPSPTPGTRQADSDAGQVTSIRSSPSGPPAPTAPGPGGGSPGGGGTPGATPDPGSTASSSPPDPPGGSSLPTQSPPAQDVMLPTVPAAISGGGLCLTVGPLGICVDG
jgi:hypothetical protein